MSKVRRFFYDTEFMEEPGFLQLISIGVVDEQGNEFYACNIDADLGRANVWVQTNVISKLPKRRDKAWLSHAAIAEKLLEFINLSNDDPVELWGYYADYDHVLLCWLFGRMIDLPDGMPMFTLDIKQLAVSLGNPPLPKKPESIHDALADAKWNRQAFQFLTSLRGVAWDNLVKDL